jgi:hypothetical protein
LQGSEEKLDETQAGLITLAAKAALEIHKQISKSTQSVEVYLSLALLFK